MRTPGLAEEVRLRAAAVILRERRILLSRSVSDPFWALPGGRIDSGELSRRALVRELREELGAARLGIGRLMFVVENRFAFGRRRFQEIGFVFEVDLATGPGFAEEGEFASAEPDLRLRWVELSDLPGLDLRPHLLRDRLVSGAPPTVEHLEVDELSSSGPDDGPLVARRAR